MENADEQQATHTDEITNLDSEDSSVKSNSIVSVHDLPTDEVTPEPTEIDKNSEGHEQFSEHENLRRSSRQPKLSLVAKESKSMELRICLSKAINGNQQALDTAYTNFEQLDSLDSIEKMLVDIDESVAYVQKIFDQLNIASENKVDSTSQTLFDDYLKEVQLLSSEAHTKMDAMKKIEGQRKQEEEEMLRMEESMARMQEELDEQNRIYEERKDARFAARAKVLERSRRSKEHRPPAPQPVPTEDEVMAVGNTTPIYEVYKRNVTSQPTQRRTTYESEEEPTPNSYSTGVRRRSTQLQNEPANIQSKTTSTHKPQEFDNTHGDSSESLSVVRELSRSLVVAIKSSKRAAPKPIVYDGNPIDFQDWELDFDAYVESEGLSGREPLRYLKEFVKEKAKEAISGHFITNTEVAYKAARRELRERFGSQHNVNRALRNKLEGWPRVAVKDAVGLRSYADLLSHVKYAMKDVPELHSLNHSQENEKLAAKLPDYMIRNWARQVKEMRKVEQRYPSFYEFVHFVVDQAEVMDEPLMKSIGGPRDYAPRKLKTSPSSSVRTFYSATKTPPLNKELCKYCKKPHSTAECYTLTRLTIEEKEMFIKENRLCYSCLRTGHQAKECPQRANCKKCNLRHPTALHKEPSDWRAKPPTGNSQQRKDDKSEMTSEPKAEDPRPGGEPKKLSTLATYSGSPMLSMVVPIYITNVDDPSKEVLVYAMLDTQSDSSYISSDTARMIQPKHKTEKITITTLTGDKTDSVKLYNNLRIRGYNQSESTTLEAYEWNTLTCSAQKIPNSVNVQQFPHLKEHAHLLPPPLEIPIGMLIGADRPEVFEPLEIVSGSKGQPFAQRTMLGWMILGGKEQLQDNKVQTHAMSVQFNEGDEQLLISQEDMRFLEILDKETRTNENGTYKMPLPFRTRPTMANNRVQAEKRLAGLGKKLDSDELFKEEYNAFMKELIDRGHAELATQTPTQGEVWYIPHFAVKHPRKSKIRVVFDCSATFKGSCLNDHLLQGPDLTNNMLGILLRFRKEPVAIACDVEKMFYNFQVNESDRDYLRFLWYSEDGSLKEYRMTVHLFGATSSPAVATYGLRKLAEDQKEIYPLASQFIKQNFYVDDGIASVETTEKAAHLIATSRSLCSKGNLRLHKFISNDAQVLQGIPNPEKGINDIDLFDDPSSTQRTLGLEWAVKDDLLKFTASKFQQKPPTRRGVLSTVSQLYDPLGLLAPYSLQGKQILQQINRADPEWDQEIPSDVTRPWKLWVEELASLEDLIIPRCIKPKDFAFVKRTELHHFCDASTEGIGACSYIRLINTSKEIHVSLLMAKSRAVPSKGVATIPRLELQGAVLATQLSTALRKELDMTVHQEYFWTDSEIVLAYLMNEKKKFHVFIANRVREIKRTTDTEQWHHVNGQENPADFASRGTTCSKLAKSIWFTGPPFLKQASIETQLVKGKQNSKELKDDDPEVKKIKLVKAAKLRHSLTMYNLLERYSSFHKLQRSIAYLQQMASNKSCKTKLQEPTKEQLEAAKKFIIKTVQSEHYSVEIPALMDNKPIPKSSKILPLTPFLDSEGLLRVGGRAKKSLALDYDEKHPVIMPQKCHISQLIATHYHNAIHHQGQTMTQGALRAAGFWITGAARLVKSLIHSCVACRRIRGKVTEQIMSDLPRERLEPSPPFTQVGIDCFGPFYVKEGRKELKKWGLLLTCLYSRAVHLEVLDDMSTDTLLNALRCFMCLRGPVETIFCDRGTNFVGACNELEAVGSKTLPGNIKFKFNAPHASHAGGVWERQIRNVRAVLNGMSTKYKGCLDTSGLRTAFYEAMTIVNSRPLSVLSINDPNTTVIAPNHLLTMKNQQITTPSTQIDDTEIYGHKMWRKSQQFSEEFWKRWKMDYLQAITKRQKWQEPRENLKEDDIVLLVEHDSPRNHWKTGIVQSVQKGDDGLVRQATVRLRNRSLDSKGQPMEKAAVLQRPVQKLIKLM